MKRILLLCLCMSIVILSGVTSTTAQASYQSLSPSPGKPTYKPSQIAPISTEHVKVLLRQTLGQRVADSLKQRVMQPVATWHADIPTFKQAQTTTNPSIRANARELYTDTDTVAGYLAYPPQQAWGASAQFNASIAYAYTWVGVGAHAGNTAYFPIVVGVNQGNLFASYQVDGTGNDLFHVLPNDQMSAEVYLDQTTNNWLIFIIDLTTGTYFASEFSSNWYNLNIAFWIYMQYGKYMGVSQMYPLTFSQARWFGNTPSGWQPITAAPYNYQLTLKGLNYQGNPSGIAWPTEIPDPPGTSFSILTCSTCIP